MESLTLSVLRQGVMASFTGGWFHDPRLPSTSRMILKYTWFILLILPTVATALSRIYKSLTFLLWFSYAILIGITFTALKIWNSKRPEPLLDLNLSKLETAISILLAIMVSIFGALLIQLNLWSDLWQVVFCLVVASSQFTLLKSVQPDPASPTHGFNRVISLSRPIYFCLLAVVLLLCQAYLKYEPPNEPSFLIYNFNILDKSVFLVIRNLSSISLLSFPLIFNLGLLPQITTFIMYVCEQIDMHLFGSTAATLGLKSAVHSICRSILTVALLYIVALASIGSTDADASHNTIFSLYCGVLVAISYALSRSSSDPTITYRLIKQNLVPLWRNNPPVETAYALNPLNTTHACEAENDADSHYGEESITTKIQNELDSIFIQRLKSDLTCCMLLLIGVFSLHVSSIFSIIPYNVEWYFAQTTILWGFLFHYVIPQMRKDLPWLCFPEPILKSSEYYYFEVRTYAKLMWFERVYAWGIFLERNVIYPLLWLSAITKGTIQVKELFGPQLGVLLFVIISLKLMRSSFNDSSPNYLTLIFTYLFFEYDAARLNHHTFIVNYFFLSILQVKMQELLLKVKFIFIYIAPWQIPWGSAFHAFAQPFSVPHSAILFAQAILSSILSAPLQPVMGSAIFLMSYVRPVRFWERDYNTNIIDINTTRLAAQLERNRIDANRLDGIFYENLTRCLQKKLCGDLGLGRWGTVSQGDCFIMASDNLNCLIHIIELGNGLCTFQLRGLEFRGTYCQQQEVEAITEGVSQDDGCCCCEPGHLPYLLSPNAAFNQRWLAWHVTNNRYVLEGYSISDNPAVAMLQPFDLRRALMTYYVKSIIYFAVTSPQLSKWLANDAFKEALEYTKNVNFADLDPTFSFPLDLDFDLRLCGVTRARFCSCYYDWIKYCVQRVQGDKNDTPRARLISEIDFSDESFLVSLCFGLSLLARRSLSAASDGQQFHTVESLLFGLHALLKGDFRITSLHDEWIFQEMKLFKLVVIPAVRMSLKLHQDHFASPDDYDDNMVLYEAISGYQKNLVISHETDSAWRNAVLSGVPSLLALRLYTDDGSNQYKVIMLNRRYLSFRIIKINRECVRGLWASQQQELIYLRNTDPERGSIQNAKQALRNLINSSCDQPVGYPIYVSPLTTSYIESNSQLKKVFRCIPFLYEPLSVMKFISRLIRRLADCVPEYKSSQPTNGDRVETINSCSSNMY